MGRISVIIPTYNRADLLTESIKAIQAQSYAVHQIIVVDDGSTDGTHAAISALPGPIQYIHQPNAGKGAALNNGLRHCSGDYIWICDDDDLALASAAELLINALENNSAAGFAFGRYRSFYINPVTGKLQISEPGYWPDFDSNSFLVSLLVDCFIFQNACLVRREAYDAVGPFRADLIRSQDYEMAIRLACRFDAAYVPEVVFMRREHEGLRGSEQDRFSSNRDLEKWLHYDAIIFSELYDRISLTEFVPKNMKGSNADAAQRAALLQRACIFFRKKLFNYSLVDMGKAIKIGAIGRLTPTEELICGRFLHPMHDYGELVRRPEIANSLYSLAAENEFGMSVVKAVTAPLLGYILRALKHGTWSDGHGLATLVLRIHGYTGTLTLAKCRFSQRLKSVSTIPSICDKAHE